jgi:predicted adenine nucleotide alpha hydrolase (AANH) superfamily ATPase
MRAVLHICCGVCAAGVAERLSEEGYQIQGFFYNPNIHPEDEYWRRQAVAERVAGEFTFPLETAPYQPAEWCEVAGDLPDEPEGGRRCDICFRLRLEKAHLYMLETGADAFTTTLTVGPRKSAAIINRIGCEIGGDRFLQRDFKKKAGFQRAIALAKQWQLYRQNYCGCSYSAGTT